MRRSGSRRSSRGFALAALVGTLAGGCNTIIGITDVPPAADATADAATPSTEAGEGTDAAQDAGALDVQVDADADASQAVEASPCGDTQSTAANCGACGHSCLGGACVMGACQPFPLVFVDSGATPNGLAQDDRYLYWTDNGDMPSIQRTGKTDVTGVATTLFTGASIRLAPIVAEDGGIYWGDQSAVSTCNPSSCALSEATVASLTVFSLTQGVVSIALDSAWVYWSEGTQEIFRASKTGTHQAPSTLWQGDASVQHVATDGRRVYFTADDGLLHVISVDGGSEQGLGAPNPAGSFDVALDDAGVYWSVNDPSQGVINRAPLSTLSPTTLASSQIYPGSVASDGTNLYWVANASAAATAANILGCAIASCKPKVLATLPTSNLSAILVDAVAIYVLQPGYLTGGIWKLAK